jgi:methionyl-tRNA formyltransferase
MNKYKIVYFGSSHHSLPTLEALHKDERYEIVGVVSQPDKPVGRKQILTPTPVSRWAQEHNVLLLAPNSWKKDTEALEKLRGLKADVGVLAIYGKILPQNVIDAFPKGIVNIHPSILPKYRGPAPAVGVILNGEKRSGVAIMLLVAEMDAGPVLAISEFDVSPTETPETYYEKGFQIGTETLIDILPKYMTGELRGQEQDHSQATYTYRLSRDNGKIDWSKSSEEIERMIRAYTPWPGTWTEVWMTTEGAIKFEREMSDRLELPFDEGNWDGVHRKRMKVLSAVLEKGSLALDKVQIEGETPVSFDSLLK